MTVLGGPGSCGALAALVLKCRPGSISHDKLTSVHSLDRRWTPGRRGRKERGEGAAATFIAVLEFLSVMQVSFSTPGMALATRTNWWWTSFLMSFFAQ